MVWTISFYKCNSCYKSVLCQCQNTDVIPSSPLVAVIGFEFAEYTVGEAEGSVEVCVVLHSPEQIEITVIGTVFTTDSSAEGMSRMK